MATSHPTTALVKSHRRSITKAKPEHQAHLQQSLVNVNQARQLLDLAKNGGKAAGWSMLGSASALSLGLLIHSTQMPWFGTIGSMMGIGLYSIRLIQRWRTPNIEGLSDELRDLEALRVADVVTETEHEHMRAMTLKKHGF